MGGGGSKQCTKQDHIDPKPSSDMNAGITVAGSENCRGCSMTFPLANTASTVSMTRVGSRASGSNVKSANRLAITPFTPFSMTFNGHQAVFKTIYVYYPAPLRVEGVQADAVVQCESDDIVLFIPLMKATSGSGASVDFLSMITATLDPATERGLGIVGKESGVYATTTVVTGQDWSLTNIVSVSDPYFTWVDSELEQYTKFDGLCDRWIGWKSKAGKQTIYMQNPSQVESSDIDKLTATIGAVKPEDVITTVTHPLYAAGEAKNCSPVLPKLKAPVFKMDKALSSSMTYLIYFVAVMLALIVAIAFINSSFLQPLAAGLTRFFSWRTPIRGASAPTPPVPTAATTVALPGKLGALAKSLGK
jgi:hypothetical protein